MDRLPALDHWDIVIEVLRSTKDNIQPKRTSHQETGAVLDSKTKTQHVTRKQKVDQLSEVDHVPTNKHSSQGESQLYIFEDNQRSCDQNDNQRTKLHNETCVENSQSGS